MVQWVEPSKAVSLIKEPELKKLVAAFAKRARRCGEQVRSLTRPARPSRGPTVAVFRNSARHELSARLEHRIGGAGDQVVVEPLDVAQEVERRRALAESSR